MDIRINLLPAELLGQQQKKRKWREWTAGGGIVLGVFLLVYVMIVIFTWQARSEASALQKSRLTLESQVNANEQYWVLQTKVAQADKLIGTALGATLDWPKIMADISTNKPLSIQLTGFSVIKSTKPAKAAASKQAEQPAQATQGQIPAVPVPAASAPTAPLSAAAEFDLQGLSANHASVGEWLEGLNKLPYLSDVRCQFSSEEDQQGQKMVRFEIKAAIALANSPAGKAGVPNEN